MPKNKIPTLSLFSGAGGLDLGFEQAGFDILACVEIEEAYCLSLDANISSGKHFSKNTQVFCTDIRNFDPTPYKNKGIRCIIGGPPCQTFSAAGRRSGGVIGTEDPRGQLYSTYCNILDVIRPDVFVFENVYGLPGANGGKPWREIVSAFESHGYQLTAEVVDAADYGVPQHRERLIMVGYKQGTFAFPMPTHGPDSIEKVPLVSVQDAIADLQDPNESSDKDLGGLYGHLLPAVPEGLNYAFFTAEMGHPEPVFAWRSKFHDLLYKVNRKEPCRTIKAQPGKFTGPFHWKNRHFTTKELKRLQSFPDDYEIVGSPGKVLEQIGNSVPPRLAYVIASSVRDQLLAKKRKPSFPLRPAGFSSTFRQRQRERSNKFRVIAAKAIKAKYKDIHPGIEQSLAAPMTTKYRVKYEGLFGREEIKRVSKSARCATVEVTDYDRGIRIDFDSNGNHSISMKVEITGLKKYMPKYDSLTLVGRLADKEDIFHAWQEIEKALVERSRFFTLIDIYGHYANRGDVVDISTTFDFANTGSLEKSIEYFSQTSNCGSFVDEDDLWRELDVSPCEIESVVREMRDLRFDFRTSTTHPIIGHDRVLCTYPFPLLSPRALVESKAVLNSRLEQQIA